MKNNIEHYIEKLNNFCNDTSKKLSNSNKASNIIDFFPIIDPTFCHAIIIFLS